MKLYWHPVTRARLQDISDIAAEADADFQLQKKRWDDERLALDQRNNSMAEERIKLHHDLCTAKENLCAPQNFVVPVFLYRLVLSSYMCQLVQRRCEEDFAVKNSGAEQFDNRSSRIRVATQRLARQSAFVEQTSC